MSGRLRERRLLLAAGGALVRIRGPLGASGRTARRLLAVPGDEPLRHPIDHLDALAAQAAQAGQEASGELAPAARQVAPRVALEDVPVPSLEVQLGAVAGQPDHVPPGGPRGQGRATGLAGVTRPVIQDQVDLAPPLPGALLERR